MKDSDWQTGRDPWDMLEFLGSSDRFSVRKARLFAVACCRRIWPALADERSKRLVELTERYADGLTSYGQVAAAYDQHDTAESCYTVKAGWWAVCYAAVPGTSLKATIHACRDAADAAAYAPCQDTENDEDFGRLHTLLYPLERAAQADLLRDIFGPSPLRPGPLVPSLLTWNDGIVRTLAQAAYDERLLPSGELDPARLAILADALTDAGCTDAALLGHLRGPGPHVRGCHAVDWILQKS
jgi:hypothetical protein